jgi:mono/diheme cytochrome c family protein
MPVIPDFTDRFWQQSRSKVQLIVSILDGKDRLMPANRGLVSDALAPDLVAYVRTFAFPVVATAPAGADAGGTDVGGADPGDFGPEFNKLVKQFNALKRQAQALPPSPAAAPFPAAKGAAPEGASPASVAARVVARGPASLFAQRCAGCHSIGGGALTGPDLKDVYRHQDREWLVQYLLNPKAVLAGADPHARQLLAESRGRIMPTASGMTRERAEAVLDFIDAESQQPKSQFASLPLSDRPFTPDDVARGRELFLGRRALANGGPACIACHAVHAGGEPEGGRLGPDLTKTYERLGGRAALTARLWAPATPTMLPTYQQHPVEPEEALSLAAYLERADKTGVADASPFPLKFFLLGLGGAVLGLAAVSAFWGSRSRPPDWTTQNGQAAPALPAARPDLAPVSTDYVGSGL